MIDQANVPSGLAAIPPNSPPSCRRFSGRLAEIALPVTGVVIGIALIAGPFLATLVRSVLYWDESGPALSWRNFSALFADPRFYQAAGNTIVCGIGATVISVDRGAKKFTAQSGTASSTYNTTDGTVFRVGTTPTSWTAVKAAAKVSIIYHLDGNSLVADEVVIGD